MGFGDVRIALRTREVLTQIAEGVVKNLRPEERVGRVYSYNAGDQSAMIMFAGESVSSLVKVHVSNHMIPTVTMSQNLGMGDSAPADIVRVASGGGQLYICDFVMGSPKWVGRTVPTGAILEWPSSAPAPPGYLLLNPLTFSSVDYPELAAFVGDTHGTHSGTTYYLPKKSPIWPDTDWITPTLSNGWVSYTETVQYRRFNGETVLRGTYRNGSAYATVMFNLPSSFRSSQDIRYASWGAVNGYSNTYVNLTGDVIPYGNSMGGLGGEHSLDGLSFPADATAGSINYIIKT